ncbi:MAG TPA: hypothetical protein VGJ07_32620 [Rugosimonospora sp.]|jgi:hypothetical protein
MNPYPQHAEDTAELSAPYRTDPPPSGLPDAPQGVDLTEDPFDDRLTEQLEAAAPRRWATRSTLVLCLLAVLVVAFVAGTQVQKRWGSSSATPAAAGPARGAQSGGGAGGGGFGGGGFGGFGGGGGGQAAGAAANTTTGTVKQVDGDTMYITTSSGQTITVKTSGSTTVQTNQAGSLNDISAGSTVSVQGQTGSDGTVSASTITKTK